MCLHSQLNYLLQEDKNLETILYYLYNRGQVIYFMFCYAI